MSNYLYNVPPPYQGQRVSTPNPQAGQYNYSQTSAAPTQTAFGAIAPGTATGVNPNTGASYQYNAPPPPPPPSYNTPVQSQGQWGHQQSQSQSWATPAPPSSAPAPAAAYNPSQYGPMPGGQQPPVSPTRYGTTTTANVGYNQNIPTIQGQGYDQYQNQGNANQQWPQAKPPLPVRPSSAIYPQNFTVPGQMGTHTQYPQQPRPLSSIGNNRPASVIYSPQGQIHSSPVQTQASLQPQPPHQTPQQHQSPYAAPGQANQNASAQYQQPDYYGQNQNPNQAPPPPPPIPQGYKEEVKQNQQGQPQHPPYSQQPPTHRYEPQTQVQNTLPQQPHQQPHQQPAYQGHQTQQSQDFGQTQQPTAPYNSAAPPPPSQTPGGSYFPPASQPPAQQHNYNQHYNATGASPTVDPATPSSPWQISPNESQPAYIAPSLSGQGVSAYQVANTNPQPGVYIPPPPSASQVPAWQQQQHAPLAPPTGGKKFKYTPPVLHPDYTPGGSKYDPNQPGQTPQAYPQQPPPQQQTPGFTPQPVESQYPGQVGLDQWNQQVGGWRPVQHGDLQGIPAETPPVQQQQQQQSAWGNQQPQQVQQPPPQNYQQPQPQPQPQQQQQAWGDQQHSQPVHNQAQQYQYGQHEPAPATPAGAYDLNQRQGQQPYQGQPQQYNGVHGNEHQPGAGSLPMQASTPQAGQNSDTPQAPIPHRTNTGRLAGSSSALSASALGFGGPGDWEHFGNVAEDESVDDTVATHLAAPSKKQESTISHPENHVELPSHPSPTIPAKEQPLPTSQVYQEPDVWPTPPAPAPLQMHRPGSASIDSTSAVHDDRRYAPTPPPNNAPTYPHYDRSQSIVSNISTGDDSHGGIDSAIQAWNQQTQPHPLQENTAQQQNAWPPEHQQRFAHDDGGWSSPVRQKISTTGVVVATGESPTTPRPIQHKEVSKPASEVSPGHSIVIDDGWSGHPQKQPSPTVSPPPTQTLAERLKSQPPATSQTFVMDDGGWSEQAQAPQSATGATKAVLPPIQSPSKPPATSQAFVVDDGGWGDQAHVLQTVTSPHGTTGNVPTQTPPTSSPPATSQTFVMDDGGWPAGAAAHQTVSSPQPAQPPGPSGTTQNFVVDDGGWPVHTEEHQVATAALRPRQADAPASPIATSKNVIVDTGSIPAVPAHTEELTPRTSQPHRETLKSPEPKTVADLYPNLDTWYKSSLERYAEMVNKEASAATDEDRTKIFMDFMMEESRIRGHRYHASVGLKEENKRDLSLAASSTRQPQPKHSPDVRRSPKPNPVVTDLSKKSNDDVEFSPGGRPILSQNNTEEYSPGGRPILRQANPAGASSLRSQSPAAGSNARGTPGPVTTSAAYPVHPANNPQSPGRNAPIAIESEPPYGVVRGPSSPPAKPKERSRPTTPSRQIGVISGTDRSPGKSGYKPFRPGGSKSPESIYKPYVPPPATAAASAESETYDSFPTDAKRASNQYRPFVLGPSLSSDGVSSTGPATTRPAPLRQSSLDSASRAARPTSFHEHSEIFFGDTNGGNRGRGNGPAPIRRGTADSGSGRGIPGSLAQTPQGIVESTSAIGGAAVAGKHNAPPKQQAPDLSARLKEILPLNRGQKPEKTKFITPITTVLESMPDSSNFITDAISMWELKAKKVREAHDKERIIRQEEQEEHTDRLFSENQIGYGDIGALEEDFKQSERKKKAKEDKEEYDSFVTDVFERTYNHFQDGIKQLMEQYAHATELMKGAVAGRDSLDASNEMPEMSQVMTVFVALHKKIEWLHGEVQRIIAERDKRFKKTVIQPLYSAGNIAEVKKMEKHFDEAEKKSALEAARRKEDRARIFNHAIEQSTMRALRESLDYMEDISQEVHKITEALPPAAIQNYSGDSWALYLELYIAQIALGKLAATSEDLMKIFHDANVEVVDAEFAVSLLAAKLHNEGPDVVKKIQDDKAKEQERLSKELAHRLSVVRNDFKKANDEITALLPQLEKLGGPASGVSGSVAAAAGPRASIGGEGPEYAARMKRALAEAKNRNAGKEDFT